jgi:hypothetical protein
MKSAASPSHAEVTAPINGTEVTATVTEVDHPPVSRLPFSSIMDSPPEGQQEATVRPLECGGAGNPFAVFVGRQSPRGGLRAHGGPS